MGESEDFVKTYQRSVEYNVPLPNGETVDETHTLLAGSSTAKHYYQEDHIHTARKYRLPVLPNERHSEIGLSSFINNRKLKSDKKESAKNREV